MSSEFPRVLWLSIHATRLMRSVTAVSGTPPSEVIIAQSNA